MKNNEWYTPARLIPIVPVELSEEQLLHSSRQTIRDKYGVPYGRHYIPVKYLPTIPKEILLSPDFPYNPDRTQRWCYDCSMFKNLDDFSFINGYKYSAREKKRGGHCKECEKKKRNPKQSRNTHLQRTYGITLEDYDLMFQWQSGLCAACGQPETQMDPYTGNVKNLAVDHDHKTGKVRQLLCQECNKILGHIEKDRDRLKKLEKYLKRHDK